MIPLIAHRNRLACDIGFGVGFRMEENVHGGGKIETTDEVVCGEVWESEVGGQTIFGWGCGYGRYSKEDWESSGSGGTIYLAMLGLTTAMFLLRGKRVVMRQERVAKTAKRRS